MPTVISLPQLSANADPDMFADLTPVPVLSVRRLGTGGVVVFDGDLDDTTRAAIVQRGTLGTAAEQTLRDQAGRALQDNRDFLADTAPTNAAVLAQVRVLTRCVVGLIRLVLRRYDGTD